MTHEVNGCSYSTPQVLATHASNTFFNIKPWHCHDHLAGQSPCGGGGKLNREKKMKQRSRETYPLGDRRSGGKFVDG